MESQLRFKEKSVIIHRDENGFGLRVGGQNPVFVDCVHENGAAWKAGVRKDDRIIKVNGTLVKSYDHQKVVQMIQNCTPFVNLTLHTIVTEQINVNSGGLQSTELNHTGLLGNSNNANNNLVPSNMKVHSLHQRLHHPHSASNLNWLLDIGDDLFQDNQQKPQQQHRQDAIPITQNAHQPVGVSKLLVSGPSPLITSHPHLGVTNIKPKSRHNRNLSSTRDNPYYYYKTAPEKGPEATSCNSATTSLISQDQQSTSRSAAGLSMVLSRSSSKSTRSTSGKFKSRNLGSRLVEDLKSLTITNSQTTPSSLSTSPSSSDLSDCDDQDSSRLDCISINTSNSSSASGMSGLTNMSVHANSSGSMPVSHNTATTKPRHTTRRLEIIRELVDTEKTHTERLKQLNDLLYKPIKAEGLVPMEQLKMVFSCHKTLFKIHRQIYKILLKAQQNTPECHQEPLIGRALVEIFEGELGKRLEKAASSFCACQSTNTDLLNRFTRKDTKAGEFLAQVATQQMIGRLGIKDLLASCFQRLTKYPLLLDNLLKATPTGTCGIHSKSLSEGSIATKLAIVNLTPTTDGLIPDSFNTSELTTVTTINLEKPAISTTTTTTIINNDDSTTSATNNTLDDDYDYERLCISRALYQSRQILINVNEAVKRAISHNKLRDIWKKTDKHPTLPVIDMETQQMLHEGPLTLRLNRRSIEVYVLLLTHYLVILTREGQDKYKLKYFTADGKTTTQFSPIFNIDEHLATRDTATDENGFYLLCKKKDDSRIYEFASQSPAERAKWKGMIHMAQMYNFAAVPDDDNTLTRYRELITLATSSNTPNNIEHSPTNNNIISSSAQSNASLNDVNYTSTITTTTNPPPPPPTITTTINTTVDTTTVTAPPNASANITNNATVTANSATTSSAQQINSNTGHDLNVRAQDV